MQGNSCNKREYERAALVIVVKGTLLTPTQRLRASSEPPPRALLQHLGAEGLSRLQNALPLAPAARDIIRPCGSSARADACAHDAICCLCLASSFALAGDHVSPCHKRAALSALGCVCQTNPAASERFATAPYVRAEMFE